jgi:uncharacterized cupin superfamily protein
MTKKMGGVVHAGDVELHDNSHGENFGGRFARIGAAAGGAQLRTSVYEIAPGRRAFPHHAHHGIEEALYVLEGEGTLRLGDEEHVMKAGSYAAFPAGGHAHQLINTGEETLRYLAMSAGTGADIVTYPDSKKVAAFAGDWDTLDFSYRGIHWDKDHAGYYDGEEVD